MDFSWNNPTACGDIRILNLGRITGGKFFSPGATTGNRLNIIKVLSTFTKSVRSRLYVRGCTYAGRK